MGLYEPKICCICFDTKNGSLILGSLALIGAILTTLNAVSGHLAMSLSVAWDIITKDSPSEYQQYKKNFILYAEIATFAWNGLIMTLSGLLIHGIRKDRPGLMLPFLAWSWTRITMEIVCGLIMSGLAIYLQKPLLFIGTFAFIIAICMDTYFVLVINAYHNKVKCNLSEDHQLLREEFDNDNYEYKVKV